MNVIREVLKEQLETAYKARQVYLKELNELINNKLIPTKELREKILRINKIIEQYENELKVDKT
jgi:hypothetical protein